MPSQLRNPHQELAQIKKMSAAFKIKLCIYSMHTSHSHQLSHLNKLEGVAANRFLSSGDQAVRVTPPPALYKGVADSREMSHILHV